ncbi:MAG: hypothetical protein ABI366_05940 [Ginsengibacter sp.]
MKRVLHLATQSPVKQSRLSRNVKSLHSLLPVVLFLSAFLMSSLTTKADWWD